MVAGAFKSSEVKIDVSSLKNIVELYPRYSYLFALNKNGELIMAWGNQTKVLETNVEEVSVNYSIIGKKKDGSFFAYGFNEIGRSIGGSTDVSEEAEKLLTEVEKWEDIVSFAAGSMYVVGVKSDGTVVAVDTNGNVKNTDELTNIKTIYASTKVPIGITKDGNVVTINASDKMERELDSWENVVKLEFGSWRPLVALHSDGTVSAYCKEEEPFYVGGWTDIVDIAAHEALIIGIKNDGTIVYYGDEDINLDHWNE